MSIDPDIAVMLDAIATARSKPFWEMTPAEVRAGVPIGTEVVRPDGIEVEDTQIAGPGGPLPIRIYRPAGNAPRRGVVFFHGGGWVICNLDTHDSLVAQMCALSDCVWVSVDYRLAPEAKFPAAFEDGLAATKWVAEHQAQLGIEGGLAVCGDSAGGGIAAAVCLAARDMTSPSIDFQLLVYPVLDTRFDTASYAENGENGLSREQMIWFLDHYLATDADPADWRVSPLRAPSLDGVPPALLVVAGNDVLRDEAHAYADRLRDAGVVVDVYDEPTGVHGFWSFPVPLATSSMTAAASALAGALSIPRN